MSDGDVSSSLALAARPLPAATRGWPELSDSLGFAGREAVDIAAAWFPHRSIPHRRRIVPSDRQAAGRWWRSPQRDSDTVANTPVSDEGHWVYTYGSDSKHRTETAALDYRLVITPGTVGLRVTDPRDTSDPTFADVQIDEHGNVIERPPFKREPISEFSAKSRTRLVRRCLSIPWGDYVRPGERIYFITLTAPADSAAVFADHRDGYRALRSFQDRVRYATGRPPRGFWKLEFQRRGAPHWHLILITPKRIKGRPIRQWVSDAWFESVGSGAESHRRAGTNVDVERSVFSSDALRLALYFAGYSVGKDKEYQHKVPTEGWVDENGSTGRFWGYFGVKPAEVEVRVTPRDLIEVKRLLRARERSQRGTVQVDDMPEAKRLAWQRKGRTVRPGGTVTVPLTRPATVRRIQRRLDRTGPRPEHGPDPIVWRNARRRRQTRSLIGEAAGCTTFVNSGPATAVAIARALALINDQPQPWPKGQRRPLP